MHTARLGGSDLWVSPLCLGGNVFGWTASETESFAILDAYVASGGNFVDTADQYCAWAWGSKGGESESIIGRWIRKRHRRDDIILATKVGQAPGLEGLSARVIRKACEASLRRLGVDHVDLYYAHFDDKTTPLSETLTAFTELARSGKVRYIAASKYSAERLAEALETSDSGAFERFTALQPQYNLVERNGYEGALADLCARENLGCVAYRGLANGFLTGKYRHSEAPVDSVRESDAKIYLNSRGLGVLHVLDEISRSHGVSVGAVALAWVIAQPTITSVIASARTTEQLIQLLPMGELVLDPTELERLARCSLQ